jgi:hypothetical protein
MSGNLFYNWFKDTHLSNIEPNSVIVLDNASYHLIMSEKIPNSNSKNWDGAESKTPPSNLPDINSNQSELTRNTYLVRVNPHKSSSNSRK